MLHQEFASPTPSSCRGNLANFHGFTPIDRVALPCLKNSLQTGAVDYCAKTLVAELHGSGLGARFDRGFDQDGAAFLRNEDAD